VRLVGYLKINMYIYIYNYIYMCVCVCVCGQLPAPAALLLFEFPSCCSIRGCEGKRTSHEPKLLHEFHKVSLLTVIRAGHVEGIEYRET